MCTKINYIADFGTGVGFRYLFWYKGVDLVRPGSGAPVYNIVIPHFTSENEIAARFGRLGVILPEIKDFDNSELCNNKINQIDPLLGYTE